MQEPKLQKPLLTETSSICHRKVHDWLVWWTGKRSCVWHAGLGNRRCSWLTCRRSRVRISGIYEAGKDMTTACARILIGWLKEDKGNGYVGMCQWSWQNAVTPIMLHANHSNNFSTIKVACFMLLDITQVFKIVCKIKKTTVLFQNACLRVGGFFSFPLARGPRLVTPTFRTRRAGPAESCSMNAQRVRVWTESY